MAKNLATCGITARQMRNFRHAEHVANMSDFRVQVGAIAVLGKQVIGVGYSTSKTHPLQKELNQHREFTTGGRVVHSAHAECMCLAPLVSRRDIDWGRVELYVVRLRNDQPFGMSRPCSGCQHLIRELGIKHIYYTTDIGYAYERVA